MNDIQLVEEQTQVDEAMERIREKITWVDFHAQHDGASLEMLVRLAFGFDIPGDIAAEATMGLGELDD